MSINRIVNTQAHQAARISAGVQDGSLTKAEAKQLAGQQLSTDKALVSAKRDDGVVGLKERAQLRGQQAQNSKDVFQQRHDPQTRPAPASSQHPRVDRQQNQAARIRDGVQDGSLTRPEAAGLAKAELRTDLFMAKAKANDGQIGPKESAVIERRQDATSKAIFLNKHDGQSQG